MKYTRLALLLCASVALLSACSSTRQWVREKYTGERTGDTVLGGRRAPILNPNAGPNSGMVQNVANAPAPVRIVPKNPAAEQAAGKAPDPYDQYDAQGNDTTRTNILKHWTGESEEKTAVTTSASGRKPFKGLVANAAAPAPAVIRPRVEPVKEVIPAPVIESLPEEENGVFLPDTSQRSDNSAPAAVQQIAQMQPAAGGAVPGAYPRLSDVPKSPAAFQELKQQKGATEQELQMHHDAAMEEKKSLEEEPTELPPVTLPRVEGLIKEIDGAIHGNTPIVQAAR